MKNLEQSRLTTAHEIGKTRVLAATRRTLKENEGIGLHWHEFYEMEMVLSGRGRNFLNGKEYNINKGDMIFMTPVDFHHVKVDGQMEIYNLIFSEEAVSQRLLYEISERFENRILRLSDTVCACIEHLVEALILIQHRDEAVAKEILSVILRLILGQIKTKKEERTEKTVRSGIPVQKGAMYMKLHFRENPSLLEIAADVGLTPGYFCKIFEEEMGVVPKKYLSDLKLGYACQLLDTTSLSVTEICFACGYNSVSNFLSYFKKRFGLSPTAYRKREKENQAEKK